MSLMATKTLQGKYAEKIEKENKELKQKIDKAIKYIKEELYEVGGQVHGSDLPYDEAIKPLLEILEGKDMNKTSIEQIQEKRCRDLLKDILDEAKIAKEIQKRLNSEQDNKR